MAEIFAQIPAKRTSVEEHVYEKKITSPKEAEKVKKKMYTPNDQNKINLLNPTQGYEEIKIDLLKPLETKPIEITLPKTE